VLGEFEALLRNETLPAKLPVDAGVNVTSKETLCPTITVNGNVMPLTVYPSPFQSADETVTSELLAVRVPVIVFVLPTATFPKFKFGGLIASAASWGVSFLDSTPPPHAVRIVVAEIASARMLGRHMPKT